MGSHPLRLQHPIVLVHGLGAKAKFGPVDYFYGLPKLLREAGNSIYVADLTAWHSIPTRAEQLKIQIDQVYPDQKVNLVGHSMGGLDCRYATSKLGIGERVESVTTVGSPNHGTALADMLARSFTDPLFLVAEKILERLEWSNAGIQSLTRANTREVFNQEVSPVPGVAYYSATSAIVKPITKNSLPTFWITHRYLFKEEGENDGMVSVESAKYGEHICTYAGDHYAQIGQIMGRARGMDYERFYADIFSRLRKDNH